MNPFPARAFAAALLSMTGGCISETDEAASRQEALVSRAAPRPASVTAVVPEHDPGGPAADVSARIGFETEEARRAWVADNARTEDRLQSTAVALEAAARVASHVIIASVTAIHTPDPRWQTINVRVDAVGKGSLRAGSDIVILRHAPTNQTDCSGVPAFRLGVSYVASLVESTRVRGAYELAVSESALIPEEGTGAFSLPGRREVAWADAVIALEGVP
jgi:hypothetical protein